MFLSSIPNKNENKNKILQKGRVVLKATLYSCVIIMILSGIALAADRDVIIGYYKPVGASENEQVQSNGGVVKKDFHLINALSARVPENKIEVLKNDPRIKYIVNDTIFRMADEYSNSWGVQYIGSQPVHNQSISGTGVKIAVLDTGIDYNHPDLAGNYKGGYDFINNDPDPWDDNCLSYYKTCHGTHVSGTIAAGYNGTGVVGVAPGSSIYAVKVLDGGGFGSASSVLSGIEWAVNNSMNIISMSLESTENNIAVFDAVNAAYDSGILLVAAAGNTYGGPVSYPAAYDSVIAVTAINQSGQKASFSPIGQKIEVAAPGVGINSTVQGGYGLLSGTSMAAPHVSGVAALIFSTNFADVNGDGKRDNKDVREIIRNTAFDAGISGKDDIYGYGIIDASNALLGNIAYTDSDLSITNDDGVSEVIAGDGNTYAYTITVKNNGTSDASNVKVSDIWAVGFTRGMVTTSSGTCDTTTSSTNFTCNLGNIAKDGTATVTVKYTVSSDTPAGNYTNRAEVNSVAQDPNPNNNVAEDKNIVDVGQTGIPAYSDLSITKDDGMSEIIAGDGNTYAYTITVKNNGPSDVSNVKVSDIWAVGFTRGMVTTSSGTCDTTTSSTNFTCNLGNIAKDGTAAVTVKYTVSSDTPAGNYTNRAEVSSDAQDPNPSNNMAEDKNIVDVRLTAVVLRTRGLPIEDAKNVSLSQGNYSIEIKNINLSTLQKVVLENGTVQLNQSSIYKFNGSPTEIIEYLYVKNMIEVDFIPYGKEKSVAYITIRRLS